MLHWLLYPYQVAPQQSLSPFVRALRIYSICLKFQAFLKPCITANAFENLGGLGASPQLLFRERSEHHLAAGVSSKHCFNRLLMNIDIDYQQLTRGFMYGT